VYTLLDNKYYLDKLYTDVIAGSVKGWIAKSVYWFNQNVLDRTVDTVGTASVKLGEGTYKYIDQMTIDGVVNGAGILSDSTGEELRHIQNGKVQQYATLLFGGATVLAGIFIIVLTA
jgi:NADH-quinone oxidoreductase subunit L